MAANQQDNNEQEDKSGEETRVVDPSLDFFSESFDPVKALHTNDLKPPVPNAKTYDNLAKYVTVSTHRSADQRPRACDLPASGNTREFERKWLPHQLPVKSTKPKKKTTNIFTKMESVVGPLTLLMNCVTSKTRIKVYTRNAAGIRGFCTGYVVLFDKHFNMALEDVYEEWTRPKRRKINAKAEMEAVEKLNVKVTPPKVTIIRTDKKTETCQRHMKQVMLRGEHVVLVVVLQ